MAMFRVSVHRRLSLVSPKALSLRQGDVSCWKSSHSFFNSCWEVVHYPHFTDGETEIRKVIQSALLCDLLIYYGEEHDSVQNNEGQIGRTVNYTRAMMSTPATVASPSLDTLFL